MGLKISFHDVNKPRTSRVCKAKKHFSSEWYTAAKLDRKSEQGNSYMVEVMDESQDGRECM